MLLTGNAASCLLRVSNVMPYVDTSVCYQISLLFQVPLDPVRVPLATQVAQACRMIRLRVPRSFYQPLLTILS